MSISRNNHNVEHLIAKYCIKMQLQVSASVTDSVNVIRNGN